MRLFHLTLVVLASTLPAQTPQPTFTKGDLGQLRCRIVNTQKIDSFSQVLTVEVHNRGRQDAEPLVFELSWRDKKTREPQRALAERAGMPLVARFGRPTAAGGKQRYHIRTFLPKDPGRVEARVHEASFHKNGRLAKPELEIGKPEQVQRTSLAGTFPVTTLTLRNPYEHDLDLLFAVTLSQPLNCTELMGVRLSANRSLDWLISQRPGNRVFVDPESMPGGPFKATKLELVDWCAVGEAEPEAGRKLLQPAYEAWYRWPTSDGVVTGEFTFRLQRQRPENPREYDHFRSRGRFSKAPGKPVRIELTADSADEKPALALKAALADVLRPDFAQLQQDNRLALVTANRVALCGPGWDRSAAQSVATGKSVNRPELFDDLMVSNDRIVSSGTGDGSRTLWESRPIGDGYLVTRRHGESRDETVSYVEQDGRWVPHTITTTVPQGDRLYSASELTLTDLRFEGTVELQSTPPVGPGVADLRTMWDRAYQMTPEPIEIEARFEVRNPGTDALWQNQQKLRGTVKMRGIGRHLRDAQFEFDGKLAPGAELALAAVIRDRWLMWYGRDFNCRPEFDSWFRGATIQAKDAAGEFRLENCRFDRVFTSEGIITGFGRPNGGTLKFKTKKFGDRVAVTRIDERYRGQHSTVQVTLKAFGDHLLPTSLKFERIFGRDWGPETITFKNLRTLQAR